MTDYKGKGILLLRVSQQYSFLSRVGGSARVAQSEEIHSPLLLYFITERVLINKHILWHMFSIYSGNRVSLAIVRALL